MMLRKPISLWNAESRDHQKYGYHSRFGTSSCKIQCPFCGTVTIAYVWSLAGGGKRCTNKTCRALHTSFGQTFDDLEAHKAISV